MNKLLETRQRIKARKPEFKQTDAHKQKKLSNNGWKKPKGHHNKRRLHLKGYQRNVEIGFRSPVEVRGFTKKGFRPVIVKNLKDVESLQKGDAAIIGRVSIKTRLELLQALLKAKFPVDNFSKPEDEIKRIQDIISSKKKAKEEKLSKKKESEKKKEAKKEEKEEKTEEKEMTEEEKIKEEKKEQEKLLIKKQ